MNDDVRKSTVALIVSTMVVVLFCVGYLTGRYGPRETSCEDPTTVPASSNLTIYRPGPEGRHQTERLRIVSRPLSSDHQLDLRADDWVVDLDGRQYVAEPR